MGRSSLPHDHVLSTVLWPTSEQTFKGIVLGVCSKSTLEAGWLVFLNGLHRRMMPKHAHRRLAIDRSTVGALSLGPSAVVVAISLEWQRLGVAFFQADGSR